MKLSVEPFTALNDWSGDGSISADSLNAIPDYVADGLAASVIFKIPAGNTGKYIEKTVAVDVTGYGEIVLSVWSRHMRTDDYLRGADFSYKIAFEGTKEFYLPAYRNFTDITIALGALTALTKVRITALHDLEDYLLCSACYAIDDEYPLDIMTAIESALEAWVTSQIGDTVQAGTAAGRKNADYMDFSGYGDFLDRYAVVKIVGANTETHQVKEFDGDRVKFLSTYDGEKVLYAHSTSPVYLQVPVVFGTDEREAAIPGITVWGMVPEPVPRATGIERRVDTFDVAGTFGDRREDQILRYTFLIDCTSRQDELLAKLNRVVRRFLGQNYLWINGRKHDFEWDLAPHDIRPEAPIETIAKSQYELAIEVREPREARQTLVTADPATVAYDIQSGGIL